MTCRKWMLPLVIAMSAAVQCSDMVSRLDLKRLLNDPAALSKLIIRYQSSRNKVLFVYGTGRVVRQTTSPHVSDSLVPTCSGRISQEAVRDLVQLMIGRHFFDLPIRSYWFATASDGEDDYWDVVKLHSIIIDDGASRARRDFGAGVYMEQQESIPEAFAAVEARLLEIEKSGIEDKPCRVAPGIRLPAAQQPGAIGEEMKWPRTLKRTTT